MLPNPNDVIADACREHLSYFAQRAFRILEPGTQYKHNWHIDCISEHLEAVHRGEIRRIIFNMPPRSLKTTLISIIFPAWVFGQDPTSRFVNTSFKFERVVAMSFRCRLLLKDKWYQDTFPQTRLDPDQGEKHNFHTTQQGQYYSSAILSATGEGGEYVMSDDPINPVDAASDTIRQSTNDAIRSTLFSRFNDPVTGRFILVMQRLHEDDPTGNLYKDGGYTLVKLPAEAKSEITIHLGGKKWHMEAGELLFPDRLPRAILEEKRKELGEYNYLGQYIQEPVALGGGEFKERQINYYQAGGIRPKEMNIVILGDAAGGDELKKKKKKLSDYTAFMVVGLGRDQNRYVLDIVRDRLNPTERVDMLFKLHQKWNELSGKPPKVGYEKYGLMSDTHYIREKQRLESYNFSLVELGGSMAKEERIRRLIPDFEQGRWFFPANLMYTDKEGRTFDLVRELIKSEMLTFPKSKYDDMLDALARVYEDDLCLTFPRPKTTLTQNILAEIENERPADSWISF